MNKTRIKSVSEIRSRAEFDQLIDDTVTMQIAKERLEIRRDARVLTVLKEFNPDIEDLSEKMQANVIRAEKYAETHRDELLPSKKKTSETTFAFFGFRIGNPTLVLLNRKWSWEKVLEELKRLGEPFRDFVAVKESVDKDLVKSRLDDAQRAAIGTRIKQEETFFIDPKRDPADPQRLVAEPRGAA